MNTTQKTTVFLKQTANKLITQMIQTIFKSQGKDKTPALIMFITT